MGVAKEILYNEGLAEHHRNKRRKKPSVISETPGERAVREDIAAEKAAEEAAAEASRPVVRRGLHVFTVAERKLRKIEANKRSARKPRTLAGKEKQKLRKKLWARKSRVLKATVKAAVTLAMQEQVCEFWWARWCAGNTKVGWWLPKPRLRKVPHGASSINYEPGVFSGAGSRRTKAKSGAV